MIELIYVDHVLYSVLGHLAVVANQFLIVVEASRFVLWLLAVLTVHELAADLLVQVLDDPDLVEGLLLVARDLVIAVEVLNPDYFSGRPRLVEQLLLALVRRPLFALLFGALVVLFLIIFG